MSDSHITVTSFFLIPAETRCVCETLCTPTTYIWPLYLTFDLDGWPWPFTTQNVQLHEVHMHAKYQVAIFDIAKCMANVLGFCFFDLWPWRSSLTLTFHHSKCAGWWDTHEQPKKIKKMFDLWPWRMTLTSHHSKGAAPWDTHACQISSCYLQYCKSYGQC